jgi:uncharacterized glyoxalase superfamily protein PhnB
MPQKLTPNLMVNDVNETIDFYRDVLGFKLITTVPPKGEFDWALMKHGIVEIMFQRRESMAQEIPSMAKLKIGGSITFFIEVQNIEGKYEALKDEVIIVRDLHTTFYGMEEFYFLDCNDYILCYAQRIEK